MKDINGKEFQLNDFIKVTGASVKNDNDIFIIDHQFDNGEFCCYKVNTKGEKKKSGYNIMFLSDRELKKEKYKNVIIEVVTDLKQASKEIKDFLYNVTASENVYSFIDTEGQTMEDLKVGQYITFKKDVLLRGHIYSFNGTYKISSIDDRGNYSLHLIGAKGETVAYNTNNQYQGRPIILSFTSKLITQLFDEEYVTIQERTETTKGEAQKEAYKMPIETETAETVTEVQQEEIPVQEEQTEATQEETQEQPQYETKNTIERKYYTINEQLAKSALSMWSFSDYVPNSTTNSYKKSVDEIYNIVDQIAEQKPSRVAEAVTIAEKYSCKYAEWINKSNHIEMMCPSVMICGGSNFPVRKKEKQNGARDNHHKELEFINGYVKKLEDILNGSEIIKSGDKDAIEKLKDKLEQLEQSQETMKQVNTYYRKNGTLDGCTLLKPETIEEIKKSMSNSWHEKQPFPSYSLTNNNASIKATKERLERLQKAKETGTKETIQSDICKVVENTEIMRIQLLFDSIPDAETRNILKSNGFKWSPSNKAWQRQLTDNARYSTKKVIEQLEKLTA